MSERETILVVDDDREIVGAIAAALEKEGFTVLRACDGMEALDKALDPELRLILMDVMMPRLDGLSAVLRIRERRNLPIIVLSAKSEESDKVLGLSMGADDYVTKPFSMQELVARVRSQLRRYTRLGDVNAAPDGTIVNGRLAYDPDSRALTADGEPVKLLLRDMIHSVCLLPLCHCLCLIQRFLLLLRISPGLPGILILAQTQHPFVNLLHALVFIDMLFILLVIFCEISYRDLLWKEGIVHRHIIAKKQRTALHHLHIQRIEILQHSDLKTFSMMFLQKKNQPFAVRLIFFQYRYPVHANTFFCNPVNKKYAPRSECLQAPVSVS